MTEEIEEGVADMCTYTASVRSEGEAKGRAEGRAEGALQKGIQIYHNMRKRGIPREDALIMADIPADAVKDED